MKLIKGKRYEWPVTLPSDGRYVNGLFTGRFRENGNAVFLTRSNQIWSVSAQNCKIYRK